MQFLAAKMAPKRGRAIEMEVDAPLQRQTITKRRGAQQQHEGPGVKCGQAAVAAERDVVLALARALGKTAADMPPLRKSTVDDEQVVSVRDVLMAVLGCSILTANKVICRLRDRYPEVMAQCHNLKFSGAGQRETLVANAKVAVQIVLVVPGEQAAKVRMEASRVFVDFLGGNVALVEEVLQNCELQERLRRENPGHWARFFGEAVEACSSSPGREHQDLVQKTCEMVLPAVTRALVDAFSSKIDNMVQQWQRQAIQQVDATLQDSILNLVRFCLVPTGPFAVPRRSAARRWGARSCT